MSTHRLREPDSDSPPHSKPRRSRLALAALLLALGSIVPIVSYPAHAPAALYALGALTVAAFVCAVFALDRIASSRGALRGFPPAFAALLLALAAPLVILPAVHEARLEAWGNPCRKNLRQLGLALAMYAREYDGWGPTIDPEARKLANEKGVPAGCVLFFRNERGERTASGLGLLYDPFFRSTDKGAAGLYCNRSYKPRIAGSDPHWINAFTFDPDEPAWTDDPANLSDHDGIGELPGRPDVILTSFVLRFNTENPHGATKIPGNRSMNAIVSDLLFFGPDQELKNHPDHYNVLFRDGSVKKCQDPGGAISTKCRRTPNADIETVLDNEIFPDHFDSLMRKRLSPAPPPDH